MFLIYPCATIKIMKKMRSNLLNVKIKRTKDFKDCNIDILSQNQKICQQLLQDDI